MINSLNSFKNVWHHPYNQQHPLNAFLRVSKWCLMKKVFKKDYTANFWGFKINIWRDSAQSRSLAFFSHLDWQEFNFIKNYLRAGDHVFDVGANIGLYTLWVMKYIGNTGKVTAFEPDDKNHKRLVANMELNRLANVTIEKLALSDSTGKLCFTAGQDVLNHLVFQQQNKPSECYVDATTLDQYCETQGIKHIALLKIDIEGAEYYAFQGAEKTLQAGRIDVILFEMNYTMRRFNVEGSQLYELLAKYGYELYDYQVESNRLIKLNEEINIDKQMNYFAIRDLPKINKRLENIPIPL